MSEELRHFGGYESVQALSPTVLMRRTLAVPDDEPDDLVVIETLDDDWATLENLLAFRERMACEARLRHDAIVPVREIGQWEGEPYLATLFRAGASLSKLLAATEHRAAPGLPPAAAATLVYEIIGALRHAHALSIGHHALRPDSVIVDAGGDVSITGFTEGALIDRLRPELDQPRDFAPELRNDKASTLTTDVYSVGMLFFRLVTGRTQPDEWEPRWGVLMMELSAAGIPGECLSRAVSFLHRTLAERASQRFESLDALAAHYRPLLEELGGPVPRELLASAIRPVLPEGHHTRPLVTQPVALDSTPESPDPSSAEMPAVDVSRPAHTPTQRSGVRGRPSSTRLLHHSTPSVRSISPSLRERVTFHPLEILARSRYQVLDEIGVGGTGTVYKVLDTTLNEIVALKVLRDELTGDPGWLQRFKRELKITRDLDHPNILPAYHLEQLDGLYFFTMRYIDGETLYERIGRNGPFSIPEGVRILEAVGLALHAAHERGIVHRDFKSANILIEDLSGHPFLMDFGIAFAPDAQSLTATGQGIGTPMYMAPEQSLGKNLSTAADIYSFGVVLYEVFCGRLPFEPGTTVAVYTAQVNGDFRPVLTVSPSLPEALARLIECCLQPEAGDRPASMRDVLDSLRALL